MNDEIFNTILWCCTELFFIEPRNSGHHEAQSHVVTILINPDKFAFPLLDDKITPNFLLKVVGNENYGGSRRCQMPGF